MLTLQMTYTRPISITVALGHRQLSCRRFTYSAQPQLISDLSMMRFVIVALMLLMFATPHDSRAADEKRDVLARPDSPMPSGLQVTALSSSFDVPPKFISGAAPIYPITRLRLREPGFAEISFVVDETGRTRDFQVVKTNYAYFGSHAIPAVRKWRFRPATKKGQPVSCRVSVPFIYKIER